MRLRRSAFLAAFVCLVSIAGPMSRAAVEPFGLTRVSQAPDGTGANGDSFGKISPDGRYVLLSSYASNLVAGDTNGSEDVFLYDRALATSELVSVNSSGVQGGYSSSSGSMSDDARYIALNSGARNLIPNDVTATGDMYVRDRVLGTTRLVSAAADGTQGTGFAWGVLSADGRHAAFAAFDGGLVPGDNNSQYDIFEKDLNTGAIQLVSSATNGSPSTSQCWYPAISADGRYVAFWSASALTPGDTNGVADVFLHDRQTNTTTLVSKASDGSPANGGVWTFTMSADGSHIFYSSSATNIVPGDTNGTGDGFIYDVAAGTTKRILATGDAEPNGQITVGWPSTDGHFIGIWSDATNLVPGATGSYFHAYGLDSTTGAFTRLSTRLDGVPAQWGGSNPSITDDGSTAVFGSQSPDLVPGKTTNILDVFVRNPIHVTIDSGPSLLTSRRSANFSFHSSKPGTLQCSLDGAAFASCASPTTYTTLGIGLHSFQARLIDAVGIREMPAEFSWKIVGQDTLITSSPPILTNSHSASFRFGSTDDGATFECALDASVFLSCSSPLTYETVAEGPHTFTIRTTDGAGVVSPEFTSFDWTIDSISPETSIDTAPLSLTKLRPARFTFSSNEFGVSYECAVDSGVLQPCVGPITYQELSEGEHLFVVRATDPAGNVDQTPATYRWSIDTIPPDTLMESGPAALTNEQSATFTFSASEDPSTIQCSLGNTGFKTCASPVTYDGLTDGTRAFRVRATDLAGNSDPSPATYRWTVDTTPPTVSIIEPQAGGIYVGNSVSRRVSGGPTVLIAPSSGFVLHGHGEDVNGVQSVSVMIDGSLICQAQGADTSCRWPAGLQPGEHTISVTGVDRANNASAPTSMQVTTVN